jgi:hypothetical protein
MQLTAAGGRAVLAVDTVVEHNEDEVGWAGTGQAGNDAEGEMGETDDETCDDLMSQWTTVSPPTKRRSRTSTLSGDNVKVRPSPFILFPRPAVLTFFPLTASTTALPDTPTLLL